jgi:hypothetical protein
METLRNLPRVQCRELPVGKLGVHEEFPALVADAVRSFLGESPERSGIADTLWRARSTWRAVVACANLAAWTERLSLYALISAALFGVSTPAAKVLPGSIHPGVLAGLLAARASVSLYCAGSMSASPP